MLKRLWGKKRKECKRKKETHFDLMNDKKRTKVLRLGTAFVLFVGILQSPSLEFNRFSQTQIQGQISSQAPFQEQISSQPQIQVQATSRKALDLGEGKETTEKGQKSTAVNPKLIDAEGNTQGSTGRLVVKLDSETSPEAVAQKVNAQIARIGPLHFMTLAVEPDHLTQTMAALQKLPGVLNVRPSQVIKVADSTQPSQSVDVSDPHYAEQWGLAKIEAPKAWALGATGQGVTIAVVDTGVDYNHPDLKDNLVSGYNAITGATGLAAARDNNGHGTHVAGIAAAELNGVGVVGVAYQAKIMPVKVMNRDGEGTDDVIADGIVWAADHGAQIINLSLGADTQEDILKEAIQYAVDSGCLVVAAAGNQENGLTTITYPASDPGVLAVTATDESDKIASFSLTGPSAALAAPGTNIFSDYWEGGRSGYATADGTSMASPFVSGVAALVWSAHPDLSAAQVRRILEDSALDLGTPGRDNLYGYGRVDAYWALQFAANPPVVSSPGNVFWSGAVVQGGTSTTQAKLTVPARTFGLDPKQSVSVTISPAGGAGSFPPTIQPVGDPVQIDWGSGLLVQKMMTLTLNDPSSDSVHDPNRVLSIYRWSGTRWLRVGGGVHSGAVSAGITEPGIYQIGSFVLPGGNRIAGADRIETAIRISQAAYPTGADTVILARADDFPDALSGAPLAYRYHAPILLTDAGHLYPDVLAEINRLNPKTIFILGGTGAISESIENQLNRIADVRRIGGVNRFDTAAQIASALGFIGEAAVVNGDNFPDAISMASIAAQKGMPILLTENDSTPSETDLALNRLAISQVIAVGGEGVISADQFANLPNATRLSGQDRYGTAAAVLQAYPPQGSTVYLATGENFPDALTGGVLAALDGTDLVLVSPQGLTPKEQVSVQSWRGLTAYAFGGSGVVSDKTIQAFQSFIPQ